MIVRDGKIVGEGVNTVTASHDPTAHGEVNAIRAAARALGSFTLAGCELYTSCEPCPMCLAAAYWARLDAVYYGASAADAARAGSTMRFSTRRCARIIGERTLPSTQLLGDEAWASFAAWLASAEQGGVLKGSFQLSVLSCEVLGLSFPGLRRRDTRGCGAFRRAVSWSQPWVVREVI